MDTQVRLGKVSKKITLPAKLLLSAKAKTMNPDATYVEVDEDGNNLERKKPRVSKFAPAKIVRASALPPNPKKPFETKQALLTLKSSAKKEDRIIALFFHFKGYKFDSAEQMQIQVKRNSRIARDLVGYTGEQLDKTMWVCEEDSKKGGYNWGLETVAKKIAEVVNK